MGLMLDSSVIIAAERGHFDLEGFMEAEAPMESIFLATVTASELLHGVYRAVPERRARREAFVEAILLETPVLPFDLACARQHARLWADLLARGRIIGAHDMMIAATCLRFGHRLATLNKGEFARVTGLEMVDTHPFLRKQ